MKITGRLIAIVMGSVFGGFMAFKGARAALAEPETWEFDEDDLIDEIFPDEESENKEAEAKAEA